MATVSAFSVCRAKSHSQIPHASSIALPQLFPIQFVQFQRNGSNGVGYSYSRSLVKDKAPLRNTRIWSAADEEGATAVVDEASAAPTTTVDQTVSVSVSPSDVLTMFFQAEGTMSDAAIPNVTKALEEIEGITDLKVKVVEGIASVELTKQTTIQATGVSSSLVETIQGSGFKLQTLNLSFQDEEDIS
ncbi:PREDICTED: uncharacterized protein LOC109236408 [Nicotiana attenuata]|uniref:Uncharacterized protein n=1 Tax=Nicotiana attenuata TaxID=49451 RepID=A0A314LGC0_NICAT|nr:PREDICTED: uncharacterized protein LOC109236408 [Nicotiana attenuata]OIT40708.1 hypothetical protein A4A49_08643 [Nicotiana attenuata]